MKAESQWPAGEDHRAALATSGSKRFRRMPIKTPYRYLRCGDLRLPGVTSDATIHSDYATTTATTTMMMMMIKMHTYSSI